MEIKLHCLPTEGFLKNLLNANVLRHMNGSDLAASDQEESHFALIFLFVKVSMPKKGKAKEKTLPWTP